MHVEQYNWMADSTTHNEVVYNAELILDGQIIYSKQNDMKQWYRTVKLDGQIPPHTSTQ